MNTLELFQALGPKDRQEDSYFILPPLPGLRAAFGVTDGVSSSCDAHAAALGAALTMQASIIRNARMPAHALLPVVLRDGNTAVLALRKSLTYAHVAEAELPAAVGVIALLDEANMLHIGTVGDAASLLIVGDRPKPLGWAPAPNDGQVSRYFGQEALQPEYTTEIFSPTDALWLFSDGALAAFLSQAITDPAALFRAAHPSVFKDNATAIRLTRRDDRAHD